MQLTDLRRAGREPALPYALELAGEPLQIEQWLRVLPGQRYVGRGRWRGRTVLAKLLVGPKAARHFAREREGAALLINQGVTTPALLAQGVQAEGGWLLFDFLAPAQSLQQAWQAVADEPLLSDGQQQVLGQALDALGQLHRKGLWQADLHLDNLLRHGDQLYWIDGGGVQVQQAGQTLSRDKVLANLGLFFAQLPASLEPFIEELLVHYLLANGEHALPMEALIKEMWRVRRWRLADYLNKAGRDCTLFSARVGAFALRVVRRPLAAELAPLLDDPDRFIAQGRRCKSGGTATVAAVELAGRPLLLKRYNIKGFKHWLSRFWRPSRAWHSWIAGHRLEQLGIATARPLAVRERRFCGLRGPAWLVTDYIAGPDALQHLAPYIDSGAPAAELEGLQQLFAALQRERISHGDFKGSNLFWDQGRWVLIDLDAMCQHRSATGFARAHARDRARFLRNWPQGSALHQQLEQHLPPLA
jgi:tRNA A-37 threonylcarbamoyl transferase component Bud32